VARLPGLLKQRLAELDIDGSDRALTSSSAHELLTTLSGLSGRAMIEALAVFEPETSARAVGQSVGSADELSKVIEDPLVFGTFTQLKSKQGVTEGAAELLDGVAKALRQDELNQALVPKLRALATDGQRLLNPPLPPGRVLVQGNFHKQGKAAVLEELRRFVAEAEQALATEGGEVSIVGSLTITAPGKAGSSSVHHLTVTE